MHDIAPRRFELITKKEILKTREKEKIVIFMFFEGRRLEKYIDTSGGAISLKNE